MLQQTRVATVRSYYQRFLARYPSVAALAAATRQEVLASWAGLGYYRRARMLHEAARRIVSEHGGRWPAEYASILDLPGIGEYTAAAIASIALDEPRAAMDGNAFRVLARLADDRRDIRGSAAKRALRAFGQELAKATRPGERGDFTQALMELGATVCVPRSPRCMVCPWADSCVALAAGTAPDLPARGPRRTARAVEISLAIVSREGRILVRQRPPDASIMPGFWELPSVEGPVQALAGLNALAAVNPDLVGTFSHSITAMRYTCNVYEASAPAEPGRGFLWMSAEDLRSAPVTTISRKALRSAAE